MFSSVNGIRMIMTKRMEGMGWNNSLMIRPGTGQARMWGRGFGVVQGFRSASRRAQPFTYNDFEAIRAEVDAKYMYGMVETWFLTTDNQWQRIRATNVDFFHANTYPIKSGRFFNAFEMNRAQKVAVVGPFFSEQFLNGEDPIGQYYTAGNNRFLIVGVLDHDPLNEGMLNFNPWGREWDLRAIYIPLRTGAVYLRTNMAIDNMYLQSHDSEGFSEMKSRATQVLLARRNMNRDFTFDDIGAQVLTITKEIDDMQKRWGWALLAIAGISLVVGGVGLFSTLLISINERMTEIGIRKSIGARDIDIFFYFILEALVLSFIAACIGIGLGYLLTQALSTAIKTNVPISMMSVYVGFGFSLVIGFLSGLYPAIKAAGINPIQAIYYFE
jgi:putative ABC transport system permease protein